MKKIHLSGIACIAAFILATTIAPSAQTFKTLAAFDGINGLQPNVSPLVQGRDGNFYGTTFRGGSTYNPKQDNDGTGTIFKVTPEGALTSLYTFCLQLNCPDGQEPVGGLVLASNGNFYGTTTIGGSAQCGTVFEITPLGKFTTIHNFCTSTDDGASPMAPLVLGADGSLYGTAQEGGLYGAGAVFKIMPSGEYTTLHSFDYTDGELPSTSLIPDSKGNFYGTTLTGGIYQGGTIFEISPSGQFKTLYYLPQIDGTTQAPSTLTLGADENLYGTTQHGGSNNGYGSIFELAPTGLTTLFSFCSPGCADGTSPQAGLTLATDGNFYGASGPIFEITPSGSFTLVYASSVSEAGLLQATNGVFYGTSSAGGGSENCPDGCGTVFSFTTGLSPFVQANPSVGGVGQVVDILGNDLTGATSVTFNGTAAEFKVISDTFIGAEVPTGATSGTIQVTTPNGTLNSNVAFQVLP
jgi:uncharacterized repeat protein (TIGR03803 family)